MQKLSKKIQPKHYFVIYLLQNYKTFTIFATAILRYLCTQYHFAISYQRTHSSMDRISDSGSDDWGSTPHECTIIMIISKTFFLTLRSRDASIVSLRLLESGDYKLLLVAARHETQALRLYGLGETHRYVPQWSSLRRDTMLVSHGRNGQGF